MDRLEAAIFFKEQLSRFGKGVEPMKTDRRYAYEQAVDALMYDQRDKKDCRFCDTDGVWENAAYHDCLDRSLVMFCVVEFCPYCGRHIEPKFVIETPK